MLVIFNWKQEKNVMEEQPLLHVSCCVLFFFLSLLILLSTVCSDKIVFYLSRKPHTFCAWQKFSLSGSHNNSIKILNSIKKKCCQVLEMKVLAAKNKTSTMCHRLFNIFPFLLGIGWIEKLGNQIYVCA